LCNGEVVPRAPGIATLIEFGHRVSSGMALVLIGGLVAGAWRGYPRGHIVRRGAALAALLIVSEALIGAGLVLLEHVAGDTSMARGYWVGGHLINTFLLTGALTLTAWWSSGGAPLRLRGQGVMGTVLIGALLAVLLLGVSGAVTALGDTLFPVATLAEGKALTFSDSAHLFVRLRIWHQTLAVAVGLLVATAAALAVRGRPAVRPLALVLVGLYTAQLALGIANVELLAPIGIQIAHLLLSDLIWIALVLLAARTLAVQPSGAAARTEPVRRAAAPIRTR
jgi:heme A synthase